MQPIIITLDGPAGSGKSTVARLLARRLGLEFLDTGAMYRGVTAAAIDAGIDVADRHALAAFSSGLEMHFDWATDPPALHVSGRDVTSRLRDPDVTHGVSVVAPVPEVRVLLVELQRAIGEQHPRLVTEGRDQGSVVFPWAPVKFYLEASPEVRARRRADQLREAGKPADVQQIQQSIIERDQRDSTREHSPLICPKDAIRVDTTDMTLEQVVEQLEATSRDRVGDALTDTAQD